MADQTPANVNAATKDELRDVVLGANTLTVAADASIEDALASITDSALTKPYVVKLEPGGVHTLTKTGLIPSYVTIDATGAYIKLADAAECNMFRGTETQNRMLYTKFVVTGGTAVVVTEEGHTRSNSDTVYVEGLETNTTLNGIKTITAVSGDTWSYAGTGAQPTWYGSVSVYNPLAGANFTRTSNIVAVTETAHSRASGDAVYITGLATDTSFNGHAIVVDITDANTWTYASTGSNGSPTGTANLLGNTHIRMVGGYYDNNLAGQSFGTAQMYRHGCCFGNISNLTIRDLFFKKTEKYCFWVFNSSYVTCHDLTVDTESAAIQFDGPGKNIDIRNVSGRADDDIVAFTNVNGASGVGGLYPGYASPSGMGDFKFVTVDGVYQDEGSTGGSCIKITGNAGYTFDRMTFNNIHGNGDTAVIAVVDDGADLVGTEGGTLVFRNILGIGSDATVSSGSSLLKWSATGTFSQVLFDGFVYDDTSILKQYPINFSGGGTITSMTFENLTISKAIDDDAFILYADFNIGSFKVNNMDILLDNSGSGPGSFIQLNNANSTIGTLSFNDLEIATNTVSTGIIVRGGLAEGAVINQLFFNNVHATGFEALFKQEVTTTDCKLFLSNAYIETGNACINPKGNIDIHLSNVNIPAMVNHFIQCAPAGKNVNIKGSSVTCVTNKFVLLNAGTPNVSIDCMGAKEDISEARLVPAISDRMYNTNAALGTLGIVGPVIYDGTNWRLMSDTTKLY